MTLQINRILDDSAIAQILDKLFVNRPVKILKTISRIGRNQISWIHYSNEITGQRFATFVSFADLLRSFWLWLETVNLLAIALFQRQAISEVVWHFVGEGDLLYSRLHGWGLVIEKDRTESLKQPRLWLELEDSVEMLEPCFVEIF